MPVNRAPPNPRVAEQNDDARKLAQALEKLKGRASPSQMQAPAALPIDRPPLSASTIRSMIIARRARDRHLPGDLFADPAWDMLLELLEAELVHRRVSISDLCSAAAVPASTALRWINRLEERGLVLRHSDPHDLRRVFIELAPETSRALYLYFAELFTPIV